HVAHLLSGRRLLPGAPGRDRTPSPRRPNLDNGDIGPRHHLPATHDVYDHHDHHDSHHLHHRSAHADLGGAAEPLDGTDGCRVATLGSGRAAVAGVVDRGGCGPRPRRLASSSDVPPPLRVDVPGRTYPFPYLRILRPPLPPRDGRSSWVPAVDTLVRCANHTRRRRKRRSDDSPSVSCGGWSSS